MPGTHLVECLKAFLGMQCARLEGRHLQYQGTGCLALHQLPLLFGSCSVAASPPGSQCQGTGYCNLQVEPPTLALRHLGLLLWHSEQQLEPQKRLSILLMKGVVAARSKGTVLFVQECILHQQQPSFTTRGLTILREDAFSYE